MNPPASAAQDAEARNLNMPQRHGSGAEPQGSEAQATRHSAAPILLEWLDPAPGSRGFYDTGRRYSVCSITIAGREYFETWKLAKGGAWFTQIDCMLKTEDLARAAAQKDSEKA